jgi:hypothetical protein
MSDDPCGHAPTTIYEQVAMLRQLYDAGWGYHQIADLTRMSHDDMRNFLAAGVPTRQAEFLLERSLGAVTERGIPDGMG